MPAKIESTHQLIKKKLVVYRRPDSDAWQCRYTVDGKKWHEAKFTIINFDILKNFHTLQEKNKRLLKTESISILKKFISFRIMNCKFTNVYRIF